MFMLTVINILSVLATTYVIWSALNFPFYLASKHLEILGYEIMYNIKLYNILSLFATLASIVLLDISFYIPY